MTNVDYLEERTKNLKAKYDEKPRTLSYLDVRKGIPDPPTDLRPLITHIPLFCGGHMLLSWPSRDLTPMEVESAKLTLSEYGKIMWLAILNEKQMWNHEKVLTSLDFGVVNDFINPNSDNRCYVWIRKGGEQP